MVEVPLGSSPAGIILHGSGVPQPAQFFWLAGFRRLHLRQITSHHHYTAKVQLALSPSSSNQKKTG
jgi:hypothetical protein